MESLNVFNNRGSPAPANPAAGPRSAAAPKQSKKNFTKPPGTQVSSFLGWDFFEKGATYSDKYLDRNNFIAAVNAGLIFGTQTINTHAGGGTGTFWNSEIANLPKRGKDYRVETVGDLICVGEKGAEKFKVPLPGTRMTAKKLVDVLVAINSLTSGNYCNMGCHGKLLGAASTIGAYNSWHDFLYFALTYGNSKNLALFVDSSMTTKFNEVRDLPPFNQILKLANSDEAVPEEYKGKTCIIFINSLPTTGVSKFAAKKWTPFIAGIQCTEYFVGLTGYYAIGSQIGNVLDLTAHERHLMNLAGFLIYWRLDHVPMYAAKNFEEALRAKRKQGVVIQQLGWSEMGLGKEKESEHYEVPPLKKAWDFDCSFHDKSPYNKVLPYKELKCAGKAIGSPDEPILVKHKKKIVARAYTVAKRWSGNDNKPGYAWYVTCDSCDRKPSFYVHPSVFLSDGLFEPAPVQNVGMAIEDADAIPEDEDARDAAASDREKEKEPDVDAIDESTEEQEGANPLAGFFATRTAAGSDPKSTSSTSTAGNAPPVNKEQSSASSVPIVAFRSDGNLDALLRYPAYRYSTSSDMDTARRPRSEFVLEVGTHKLHCRRVDGRDGFYFVIGEFKLPSEIGPLPITVPPKSSFSLRDEQNKYMRLVSCCPLMGSFVRGGKSVTVHIHRTDGENVLVSIQGLVFRGTSQQAMALLYYLYYTLA